MLQIEEKLILVSELVKNVVITVSGSIIGKELESSVVFILLVNFNDVFLLFFLCASNS